jgi:hypothetical protein
VACLTWAAWVVWAAWACNCPLPQGSTQTFDLAQETPQEIAGFFYACRIGVEMRHTFFNVFNGQIT